jgi:hypothetical protein
MSTSYNAYVILGIPVSNDMFTVKKPNPLWGKAKFDPNTGEKVEKFIENFDGLETLLDEIDNTTGLIMARDYDGEPIFAGVLLADVDEGFSEIKSRQLVAKLEAKFIALLDRCGVTITADKLQTSLVVTFN